MFDPRDYDLFDRDDLSALGVALADHFHQDRGHDVVLATVHGSHLYGLAHEGSDLDLYLVSSSTRRNHQSVVNGLDVSVLSLSTYLDVLSEATHQAVEALNSPYAEFRGPYTSMLRAYRPSRSRFAFRALRAAQSFERRAAEGALDPAKALRHKQRLNGQVSDMLRYGRFDPSRGPQYCAANGHLTLGS